MRTVLRHRYDGEERAWLNGSCYCCGVAYQGAALHAQHFKGYEMTLPQAQDPLLIVALHCSCSGMQMFMQMHVQKDVCWKDNLLWNRSSCFETFASCPLGEEVPHA
jgi:hypothetical protein